VDDDRWVVGVDGCRAGWMAVFRRIGDGACRRRVVAAFTDILGAPEAPAIIAVDMPIGLPERIVGPGRAAEQAVRPLLGARQSSVFSIPARAAVMAEDYRAACAIALATSEPPKKVSKQSFNIFPKIREIDAVMTAALESRVFEVHPELAFWRLNDGAPMSLPKLVKGRPDPEGIHQRKQLLERFGFEMSILEQVPPKGAAIDDVVDACVTAIIAERLARGQATSFPPDPPRDARGLRIAIWA